MAETRGKIYEWKDMVELKKYFSKRLSDEEFNAIWADVKKDFKIRPGISVEESNKQFLNKLGNRIYTILERPVDDDKEI